MKIEHAMLAFYKMQSMLLVKGTEGAIARRTREEKTEEEEECWSESKDVGGVLHSPASRNGQG